MHFNEISKGASYEIKMEFVDILSFNKMISKFEFHGQTFNTGFINYMIWVRIVFILISIIAGCFFTNNIRKFQKARCYEQDQILN